MIRRVAAILIFCWLGQITAQEKPAASDGSAAALPKDWKISYGSGGDAALTLRRANYLLADDQVWQIRSPKKLWTLPVRPAKGPAGQVAAISEDGNSVLIQEKDSGAVSLFSRKGPKKLLAEEQP